MIGEKFIGFGIEVWKKGEARGADFYEKPIKFEVIVDRNDLSQLIRFIKRELQKDTQQIVDIVEVKSE